jgi:hypothetical protein
LETSPRPDAIAPTRYVNSILNLNLFLPIKTGLQLYGGCRMKQQIDPGINR